MHLEAEQLERLIAGELPEDERRALGDHVEGCPECASDLEAARREDEEIGRLLSSLDHPVPQVDALGLARRARRRRMSPRLAAAAIALLVFAGAAAAIPGSPLRSWLSGVLDGVGEAERPGAEGAGQAERQPAGISVVPTAGFEVVFADAQESGVIRIRIADQAEVVVRSDSEGVGYSVEPRGVRVLNAGARADHEVVLPMDAKSIVIRVGETVVYEMRDGRVVTPASGAVTESYIVDLSAFPRERG